MPTERHSGKARESAVPVLNVNQSCVRMPERLGPSPAPLAGRTGAAMAPVDAG